MAKHFILLFFSLSFLLCFAQKTAAQEIPGSTQKEETPTVLPSSIFKTLPDEIQLEIMQEADEQFNACVGQLTYSLYHDCECLALSFIDYRTFNGPEESTRNVWKSLQSSCVDKPAIKANAQQQCMYKYDNDNKYKEFCTCVGTRKADKYETSPVPNSDYIQNITVASFRECLSLKPR